MQRRGHSRPGTVTEPSQQAANSPGGGYRSNTTRQSLPDLREDEFSSDELVPPGSRRHLTPFAAVTIISAGEASTVSTPSGIEQQADSGHAEAQPSKA